MNRTRWMIVLGVLAAGLALGARIITTGFDAGIAWTPQMFGAAADGSTDDKAAIQKCWDASSFLGTCRLPPGIYSWDNSGGKVTYNGPFTGRFVGEGNARIRFTSNSQEGLKIIVGDGAVFENLRIEFAGGIGATKNGINFEVNGGAGRAKYVRLNGIYTNGGSGAAVWLANLDYPMVSNAWILHNQADGLHCTNCLAPQFVNITTNDTGDDGVALTNGWNYTIGAQATLSNINASNSRAALIRLEAMSNVALTNFVGDSSGDTCLAIDQTTTFNGPSPQRVTVSNGVLTNCGLNPALVNPSSLGRGIDVFGQGATDVMISHVQIKSVRDRGVSCDATVAHCQVSDVTVQDAQGGAIVIASAMAEIRNNTTIRNWGGGYSLSPVGTYIVENNTSIDDNQNPTAGTARRSMGIDGTAGGRIQGSGFRSIDSGGFLSEAQTVLTAVGINYNADPSVVIGGLTCTVQPDVRARAMSTAAQGNGQLYPTLYVKYPGENCNGTPTCSITGGGGSGATCSTALNTALQSLGTISVGAGGSGYVNGVPVLETACTWSWPPRLSATVVGGAITGVTGYKGAGALPGCTPSFTVTGGTGASISSTVVTQAFPSNNQFFETAGARGYFNDVSYVRASGGNPSFSIADAAFKVSPVHQGSPTLAVATSGAGTGGTLTAGTGVSDYDGSFTVATGTSPGTSSTFATVTFGLPFVQNGARCTVLPANAAAQALTGSAAPMSSYTGVTSALSVTSGSTALPASTSLIYTYHCDQI